MRTLIKNPMKLLIIVERSKGERSIPEMDKVLDQSSTPAIQFRRNHSSLNVFDKLAGEVVGSHTMTVMELSRLLKQRLKVAPSIDILLMVRHFS